MAATYVAEGVATFLDVDYSQWYGSGVLFCSENGLITGYGSGDKARQGWSPGASCVESANLQAERHIQRQESAIAVRLELLGVEYDFSAYLLAKLCSELFKRLR